MAAAFSEVNHRVESVLGFHAELPHLHLRLVEVAAQVVLESFALVSAKFAGSGQLLACQFHGFFPGLAALFLTFVK